MSEAEHFKAWLKSRKLNYRFVAEQNSRSISWIGEVMRGHYPWYKAGRVPGNLWNWARRIGMPDLPTTPAADTAPTEPGHGQVDLEQVSAAASGKNS